MKGVLRSLNIYSALPPLYWEQVEGHTELPPPFSTLYQIISYLDSSLHVSIILQYQGESVGEKATEAIL